ncbi:MAG TPA: FmdB family zinc ribbon protein [Gaiellaceae bacterium]|jgi:putative FmdB family regulatory protein|nr:FmdB family zinc ribbon protein [Gaiellaceae bacterium]
MPFYEYKCPNGHMFEVFHGMSEPGPQSCEVCGASPLERVLFPVAVHYKGSGFYSTDYGRGGRKAKDSGSSESSGGSSDSSGSSESSSSSSGNSSSGDSSSGGSSGGSSSGGSSGSGGSSSSGSSD